MAMTKEESNERARERMRALRASRGTKSEPEEVRMRWPSHRARRRAERKRALARARRNPHNLTGQREFDPVLRALEEARQPAARKRQRARCADQRSDAERRREAAARLAALETLHGREHVDRLILDALRTPGTEIRKVRPSRKLWMWLHEQVNGRRPGRGDYGRYVAFS